VRRVDQDDARHLGAVAVGEDAGVHAGHRMCDQQVGRPQAGGGERLVQLARDHARRALARHRPGAVHAAAVVREHRCVAGEPGAHLGPHVERRVETREQHHRRPLAHARAPVDARLDRRARDRQHPLAGPSRGARRRELADRPRGLRRSGRVVARRRGGREEREPTGGERARQGARQGAARGAGLRVGGPPRRHGVCGQHRGLLAWGAARRARGGAHAWRARGAGGAQRARRRSDARRDTAPSVATRDPVGRSAGSAGRVPTRWPACGAAVGRMRSAAAARRR
jgi:hypothetical protein